MLVTYFSTAPPETTSALAIAALDRPSAISPSTSFSRGVRSAMPRRWLARRSWDTTSGSSTVPPAATRVSASRNSLTSAIRSFSRYPTPSERAASSLPAYRVSTYWENTSTPTFGCAARTSMAARSPSSVSVGGIRTSTTATSGWCAATAGSSPSAVPTSATTW